MSATIAPSSSKRILREHQAELTARLETVTTELSAELGIESPMCTVIGFHGAVAGVKLPPFGRKPQLIVSRAAMNKLGDMELRWAVGHELGHLVDMAGLKRWQAFTRIRFLVLLTVTVGLFLLPVPLSIAVGLALLAPTRVAAIRFRRAMERAADRTAHRCCATDPDAGRRTLETMRKDSGAPSERLLRLMEAYVGYPPFSERIAAPAADAA